MGLADAQARRKAANREAFLSSPAFRRIKLKKDLELLSKVQKVSDQEEVLKDIRKKPKKPVHTPETTSQEQLVRTMADLLSKMEILQENYQKVVKENQELRSSISGSSDSQAGDTGRVPAQGESTPIPKAVGTGGYQLQTPPTFNKPEQKQKYCDGTPDVSKCTNIIKSFKQGLSLREVSQWTRYLQRIKEVIAEQMYDVDLIDIKKVWDPDALESNLQRAKRVELYKIIVGTVGEEHHAWKTGNPCMY